MAEEGNESLWEQINEIELQVIERTKNLQLLESENENMHLKVKNLKNDKRCVDGNIFSHVAEVIRVIKLMGKDKVYVKFLSQPVAKYVVDAVKRVDITKLMPSTRVALRNTSFKEPPRYVIQSILPEKVNTEVENMVVIEVPDTTFAMIYGLDQQIMEVKEVFVLPIEHPELFEMVGVDQPKCAVLYGPPGNGKTMLARAVANHANCCFLRASATEFVSKYLGASCSAIKDLFTMAKNHAPAIIFIDEIDALGSAREGPVHRTLVQLMSELDEFGEPSAGVKVMFATNRLDSMDKSFLMRIDRKIEIPNPSEEARMDILKVHTLKMNNVPHEVLEKMAKSTKGASAAQLKGLSPMQNGMDRHLHRGRGFCFEEKRYSSHAGGL